MNATGIIVIAVAAVVVLGMISFLTLARRSDVRGAGALSSETRQRDRAARAARPVETPARNAAEAEAEGVAARSGMEVVPVAPSTLAPWVPPDPEAIGVSRRMFFNRATVALMSAGLGTFAAASFVAFLWPFKTGGFGGKVAVGSSTTSSPASPRAAASSMRPKRARGSRLSERRDPKAEACTWSRSSPYAFRVVRSTEVPAPRCRVPQCVSSQLSNARPRLAVQPRR